MIKHFLVVCTLFLTGVSVFGQNALEKDLNKSLKKYELIEMDNRFVLEKAKTKQPIRIEAYGREFEFVLTPHDLRAANYRAIETTESGDNALERGEITTFRSRLKHDPDSEVRFSTTSSGVEGLIYTSENKKFYVVQARKFSRRAVQNEAVVFSEEDLNQTVDLSNDGISRDDFEEHQTSGFDRLKSYLFGSANAIDSDNSAAVPTESAAAAAALQVLEVATEADYQWVTAAGGAAAANSEILGILNLVDGIYKRDLNLSISVTYQHAWSTADPYPATSMGDALNSFTDYWNANYPYSRFPRDTAHLFTGKFNFAGLAWIGAICKNPSYAYGLTGRSGAVTNLITAHEIGHNLNAQHVDNSGSCANSMMNPSLSDAVTGFCDVSKSQIINYAASYGTCLSAGGSGTPTPTPTPSALSISGYVVYGSTPAGQPTRFVPGVLMSIAGTIYGGAYTNQNGAYQISNLPANGSYFVTPSKSGDVNGITSFDGTMILRYAASGTGLTANQILAADVNNSGSVTSFDATLVLRYVSSGGQSANAGTWKFVPGQRNYSPLLNSRANENYEAILLGDVNGSWMPAGFATVDDSSFER